MSTNRTLDFWVPLLVSIFALVVPGIISIGIVYHQQKINTEAIAILSESTEVAIKASVRVEDNKNDIKELQQRIDEIASIEKSVLKNSVLYENILHDVRTLEAGLRDLEDELH